MKQQTILINEKDQLFLELLELIPAQTGAILHLAQLAGVSYQTVHNWKYGVTMAPRIDTLTKVAQALGYEITLKKSARPGRKLKIVK